jgi:hypothetical protein
MIKSEIYRGKIWAGDTNLLCTISIEQPAPMQIIIRKGVFRNGITYTLPEDCIIDIPISTVDKWYRIELGYYVAPQADILVRSKINFYPPIPDGWKRLQTMILYGQEMFGNWEFKVPANSNSLGDLYVFTTEQGSVPIELIENQEIRQ